MWHKDLQQAVASGATVISRRSLKVEGRFASTASESARFWTESLGRGLSRPVAGWAKERPNDKPTLMFDKSVSGGYSHA